MSKSNRRKKRKAKRNKVWVDPTQDMLFQNANTTLGRQVLETAQQKNEYFDPPPETVSLEDWAWKNPETGEWTAW